MEKETNRSDDLHSSTGQNQEPPIATDHNQEPHPPTDHNPYPYPIQEKNGKGWVKALWALIIVAVVVTLFCVVVGVYEHHEEGLQENAPTENVVEMSVNN